VTARQPQAVFLGANPFVHVFQAHTGYRTLLEHVGVKARDSAPGDIR
jgi:hypothetical protein